MYLSSLLFSVSCSVVHRNSLHSCWMLIGEELLVTCRDQKGKGGHWKEITRVPDEIWFTKRLNWAQTQIHTHPWCLILVYSQRILSVWKEWMMIPLSDLKMCFALHECNQWYKDLIKEGRQVITEYYSQVVRYWHCIPVWWQMTSALCKSFLHTENIWLQFVPCVRDCVKHIGGKQQWI